MLQFIFIDRATNFAPRWRTIWLSRRNMTTILASPPRAINPAKQRRWMAVVLRGIRYQIAFQSKPFARCTWSGREPSNAFYAISSAIWREEFSCATSPLIFCFLYNVPLQLVRVLSLRIEPYTPPTTPSNDIEYADMYWRSYFEWGGICPPFSAWAWNHTRVRFPRRWGWVGYTTREINNILNRSKYHLLY